VKCIEKFTIVAESELVLHFAYQFFIKQRRFNSLISSLAAITLNRPKFAKKSYFSFLAKR